MSSPEFEIQDFDPLTQVISRYDVGQVARSPQVEQTQISRRTISCRDTSEASTSYARRCFMLTSGVSLLILIFAFGIRATQSGDAASPFVASAAWIAEALGLSRPEPLPFQGRKFGKYTEAELWSVVQSASSRYHVAPDLIWAMIHVESRFNHQAHSHAGAMGLMQLMPHTAKELRVNDPYDAYQNIHGGTKYMSGLLERFNGKKEMALAAYNAGPGAVDKHNGIPPYRETRDYVSKVMGLYKGRVRNSG